MISYYCHLREKFNFSYSFGYEFAFVLQIADEQARFSCKSLVAHVRFFLTMAPHPKLWVVTYRWIVDLISVGRESHSKFKLMLALFQII